MTVFLVVKYCSPVYSMGTIVLEEERQMSVIIAQEIRGVSTVMLGGVDKATVIVDNTDSP